MFSKYNATNSGSPLNALFSPNFLIISFSVAN